MSNITHLPAISADQCASVPPMLPRHQRYFRACHFQVSSMQNLYTTVLRAACPGRLPPPPARYLRLALLSATTSTSHHVLVASSQRSGRAPQPRAQQFALEDELLRQPVEELVELLLVGVRLRGCRPRGRPPSARRTCPPGSRDPPSRCPRGAASSRAGFRRRSRGRGRGRRSTSARACSRRSPATGTCRRRPCGTS